jgi:hypothetical protein
LIVVGERLGFHLGACQRQSEFEHSAIELPLEESLQMLDLRHVLETEERIFRIPFRRVGGQEYILHDFAWGRGMRSISSQNFRGVARGVSRAARRGKRHCDRDAAKNMRTSGASISHTISI